MVENTEGFVVEVRDEGEEGLDGDESEDLRPLSVAAKGGEDPQNAVGGTECAMLGIEECPSIAPNGCLDFEVEEEAKAGKVGCVVAELEDEEVIVGVDVDVEQDADDDEKVLYEEVEADVAPEAVTEGVGIECVFPR